nr:immunoglobulin heavy chain junction region [Mus musculus]
VYYCAREASGNYPYFF